MSLGPKGRWSQDVSPGDRAALQFVRPSVLEIPRIMGKKIAKYQEGVAFRKIDRHGGRVVETNAQVIGLYPGKYTPDLPPGEDPVEANVFANPFNRMSGQYLHDFWAEVWIYGS